MVAVILITAVAMMLIIPIVVIVIMVFISALLLELKLISVKSSLIFNKDNQSQTTLTQFSTKPVHNPVG
jgi:hypothetical protein